MDNATTTATPMSPRFDMQQLRHAAVLPKLQGPEPIHMAPQSLEDLNAELASLNMENMEFIKYEQEEDPHLAAFLGDSSEEK